MDVTEQRKKKKMNQNSPVQTQGVRTTADSIAEGRMMAGISSREKRGIIKKVLSKVKKKKKGK